MSLHRQQIHAYMRSMKKLLYDLIRPLFVNRVDPNEDFNCIDCGEPVLRRVLFCSKKCYLGFVGISDDYPPKDPLNGPY